MNNVELESEMYHKAFVGISTKLKRGIRTAVSELDAMLESAETLEQALRILDASDQLARDLSNGEIIGWYLAKLHGEIRQGSAQAVQREKYPVEYKEDYEDFWEMFRDFRLQQGLTQSDLAHRAGISAKTLWSIEQKIPKNFRMTTLYLLLDCYSINPPEKQESAIKLIFDSPYTIL